MPSDWRRARLAELGRIVTGKTPPSAVEGCFGGGTPFVTPSDYDGSKYIRRTARTLTTRGQQEISGVRLPSNAVMVTCIGSDMGKAAMNAVEAFTNQQINSLIVESGDLPEYVYYNLSMRKSELRAKASGSAQPILNKSAFGATEIELPGPRAQAAIVEVLRALDDRIDLLRQTNATLESIAQALFKSWFIDFDPVRAKAEGGEPEGMDAATAALFPLEFVESAMGLIPKGWSTRPVYEMAEFINGAAYKAFEPNAERRGLPIIKIAELKAGVTALTAFSDVRMPSKFLIETGDLLFAWSGNPDTSIDTFVWPCAPAWLNQHIFRVLPKEESERPYVLQALRHLKPTFSELARNKQTTGLGHVTVADLRRLMLVWPEESILVLFGGVVGRIQEKILLNSQRAISLTELRGTLLPRLLSGTLCLPEAQEQVEDALA